MGFHDCMTDELEPPDSAEKSKLKADAILGEAMARLSVHEREKELEDLHGVIKSNENKEPAQSVNEWLQELDRQIYSIKHGTLYEVAESMNREFVTNRDFRMMFLRAERYNPQAAATRMIKFLHIKGSLFGIDKLAKVITMNDLDEDDMQCLKSGNYQVLPCTDAAGRTVFLGMPSLTIDKPAENQLRARYYVIMSALKSEQAQIRGFVTVWYTIGNHSAESFESNTGFLWDLPVRREGIHFCLDSMRMYVLGRVAFLRLPSSLRSRVRIHAGSQMECQHALTTFGILRSALPISPNGEPLRDHHLSWVKHMQCVERNETNSPDLSEATGYTYADVIFGRGRKIQEHVGNINLRRMLEQYRRSYDQCSRSARQDIAEAIVKQIKANGGRFLKRENSGWKEVSDSEARIKVTTAFRSQRKFEKEKGREEFVQSEV
eukprot:scaffold26_cov117-Cylindrotheca_fusiformis.AAC.6